jgi:hypothetical protein
VGNILQAKVKVMDELLRPDWKLVNLTINDLIGLLTLKEKPMAINIATLLALSSSKDDLSVIEDLGGEFSEALKEAVSLRQEEKKKEAAGQIIEVMRCIDTTKTNLRCEIREYRKAEKRAKERLDAMDRAWLFAQHTQSFGPILVLLGLYVPSDEVREVPKDWTPPTK